MEAENDNPASHADLHPLWSELLPRAGFRSTLAKYGIEFDYLSAESMLPATSPVTNELVLALAKARDVLDPSWSVAVRWIAQLFGGPWPSSEAPVSIRRLDAKMRQLVRMRSTSGLEQCESLHVW